MAHERKLYTAITASQWKMRMNLCNTFIQFRMHLPFVVCLSEYDLRFSNRTLTNIKMLSMTSKVTVYGYQYLSNMSHDRQIM